MGINTTYLRNSKQANNKNTTQKAIHDFQKLTLFSQEICSNAKNDILYILETLCNPIIKGDNVHSNIFTVL